MSMDLVDTHCHIHEAVATFTGESETRSRWQRTGLTPDGMIHSATQAGVADMICVGTTLADSELAVEFVRKQPACWASIGIHPHEAKNYTTPHLARFQGPSLGKLSMLEELAALADKPKVVAVGECGLDYFYSHSPKTDQEKLLRFQIELALAHDLPMIFHVREAFGDFWPIFDSYPGVHGVVHSFSATRRELDEILARDLYVGLNGIMTFTRDAEQLAAAKAVPIDRLLLETDAPFLTPAPHRGTICTPKHVRVTAEFLASLKGENFEKLAHITTQNAHRLFNLAE